MEGHAHVSNFEEQHTHMGRNASVEMDLHQIEHTAQNETATTRMLKHLMNLT